MADSIFEKVHPIEIESPCVLVCMLDNATGWCLGCGRTGEEIAGWTQADPGRRKSILDQIPHRIAHLRQRTGESTP